MAHAGSLGMPSPLVTIALLGVKLVSELPGLMRGVSNPGVLSCIVLPFLTNHLARFRNGNNSGPFSLPMRLFAVHVGVW